MLVSQQRPILAASASEAVPEPLPENIGLHIRMVQIRIFREFYRVFEGTGITPATHTAMTIIRENPGIRQGTLAEVLMVRPPNMTSMLFGLEKAGLVRRSVDEIDRRATLLYLTDPGQQALDAAQQRLDALEGKLLQSFDDRERRELRGFLDRILEQVR
jgi:DNA-binding MarR family transcriptional regulator